MNHLTAFVFLTTLLPLTAQEQALDTWQRAVPAWKFQAPVDHYLHADFRTEWWYLTGNLQAADGREYGYQFTIFRRGLRAPGQRTPVASRFIVDHLALGHFTLTDIAAQEFHYDQKLSRGAWAEAGFGLPDTGRPAWIDGSEFRLGADGAFSLISNPSSGITLRLNMKPERPVIVHGKDGVSMKSAGSGNASHYYSITRLHSTGTLEKAGKSIAVTGTSWLDREWSTHPLAADQLGWDWFSLHLADGNDLMLYQLRRTGGTTDPASSGTWIDPQGNPTHFTAADYTLTPRRIWTSPHSPGRYPVVWDLHIPSKSLKTTITAVMDDQELNLQPVTYWEGAAKATGTHPATGYMELTGYASPLTPLHGGN